MTQQEKDLLTKLGECYNAFAELPKQHESDMDEVRFHIHALQNIAMARMATRAVLEFFAQVPPNPVEITTHCDDAPRFRTTIDAVATPGCKVSTEKYNH